MQQNGPHSADPTAVRPATLGDLNEVVELLRANEGAIGDNADTHLDFLALSYSRLESSMVA